MPDYHPEPFQQPQPLPRYASNLHGNFHCVQNFDVRVFVEAIE
jgi:hypothetical protein